MRSAIPTIEDVERISAVENPVVRNLRITQCYHELSAALAESLGTGANWCTFATWASKQAGQTIRQQDLQRAFERILGESSEVAESLNEILRRFLSHSRRHAERSSLLVKKALSPAAKFDRASDAVARGNLKVFAEVAREFARFLDELGGAEAFDERQATQFARALRPGDPPEGQRFLREAFTNYHRARFETDGKARAELVLLANLQIGLHEQTRLQPQISEALDAPVVDVRQLRRSVLAEVFGDSSGFWRRLHGYYLQLTAFVDRLWGRVGVLLRHKAHLAITELLSSLRLPGAVLRLGRDLRAPYPPNLRDLSNDELVELIARYDPVSGSTRGSGAEDWGDLDQRMHFITELFRSHQDERRLHEPPFAEAQIRELEGGRLPDGDL